MSDEVTTVSWKWLEVAAGRIRAGEPEADTLRDYGYVRESEIARARAETLASVTELVSELLSESRSMGVPTAHGTYAYGLLLTKLSQFQPAADDLEKLLVQARLDELDAVRVLVKFDPPHDGPIEQRIAELKRQREKKSPVEWNDEQYWIGKE